MKKRVVLGDLIVGSIAVPTMLAGLSWVGIRKAQENALLRNTKDAAGGIAGSVLEEHRAGRSPSPAEIESLIRTFIDGSVISAGPDRIFGTSDDIAHPATAQP